MVTSTRCRAFGGGGRSGSGEVHDVVSSARTARCGVSFTRPAPACARAPACGRRRASGFSSRAYERTLSACPRAYPESLWLLLPGSHTWRAPASRGRAQATGSRADTGVYTRAATGMPRRGRRLWRTGRLSAPDAISTQSLHSWNGGDTIRRSYGRRIVSPVRSL